MRTCVCVCVCVYVYMEYVGVFQCRALQRRPRKGAPPAPPRSPQNPPQRLRVLAKAADCISAGDAFNRRVRGNAQWALMPAAGLVGTVMPAVYMRGRRESMYDNDVSKDDSR